MSGHGRALRAFFTLVLAAGLGACPALSEVIALRDVQVVDPDRSEVRAGQTVLIEDGRITAVGPTAAIEIPSGATLVDGTGRFLIPGLWDMHTHIDAVSPTDLLMLVSQGVTSVRDMGGDPFRLAEMRRRIEAGTQIGPDIVFAGPILEDRAWLARVRGEYPDFEHRVPVDNPEEAYATVALARQWGAGLIKIRNVTDRQTFRATMEAARAEGLTVAGHEPIVVPIAEAARLGMTTIEHVPYISLTMPGDEADEARLEETIAALLEAGTYLSPTLIASNNLGKPTAELLARVDEPDPRDRYLSTAMRDEWRLSAADDSGPLPWGPMRERSLEMLRQMQAEGVPLLAGTDLGVPFTFPGFALHDELGLLTAQLGISPGEALRAATTNPAGLFGLPRGIVEGAVGSVVLLRADPLADIAASREIDAVVLRGRLFDRAALDELMKSAARDKDKTSAEERRDEVLTSLLAECEEEPSAECRRTIAGYYYSKGQFATARRWLERNGNDPESTGLLFATYLNLLFAGDSQCIEIDPVATRWLAQNGSQPDRTLGILAQVLAPLAASGCTDDQARYLRQVVALDADTLAESSRPLHVEHSAAYLAKVEGKEEEAYALRESLMPEGWRDDSAAVRSLADWCLAEKIALSRGRELAQRAKQIAKTDFDRLYAMMSEAQLAGELEDYTAAVALLEQIQAVVTNERIESALENYRALAAQSATESDSR